MKLVNELTVTYHNKKVGTLTTTPDSGCCAFQYDEQWLAEGFSISPLQLPLKSDLFIAPFQPFNGNFGIFEDSLPDGYVCYLLDIILRKEGINALQLTPIQRLSIVGSAGMGALCYLPETYVGEEKSLPSLDSMQQMALAVLSEKDANNADVLYFNSGNSGGCRPKCLLHDQQGDWIVKFRHVYDPKDMGLMEYHYNQAAQQCDIIVPDFKLIEEKYFATKRFDILNGNRLHIASASALLNEPISQPKMEYRTLLQLTGFLSQDPAQVEQMFRRMVFNILADNKDDHAKNFSFICSDKGLWSLAPAYDLTCCAQGYNGQHATSINYKGNPTLEDMLIVGQSIRISQSKGMNIISQIYDVCKQMEVLSKEYSHII